MEPIVQRFASFAEAALADREYYRQLTPHQRLAILDEIVKRGRGPNYDPQQRLARVYRIVKFSER
jgi:hypothetical protein